MGLREIYNRPTITDKQHVLTFGRYYGKTVEFVMELDPSYLIYCHNNIDWFDLSSNLLLDIEQGIDAGFDRLHHLRDLQREYNES